MITLTPGQMLASETRGQLRQNYGEEQRLNPVGHASILSHTCGAMLEQATANFLGIEVPDDWTLQGDRSRGGDLLLPDGTKIHCRSSMSGRYWWRPWDSQTGVWVFGTVEHAPLIMLTGWLYAKECGKLTVPGKPYPIIPLLKTRPMESFTVTEVV